MFWIGFMVGLIIGACLGITIYGLMAISKWADLPDGGAQCQKTIKAL